MSVETKLRNLRNHLDSTHLQLAKLLNLSSSEKDSNKDEESEKSTKEKIFKEKSSSTKASSSSKHVEKEDATESAETAPSSATATRDGSSIVVQSGEGAGSTAARAGISVDELERLNPDHMTSGYWYANPGDVVNVQ